jgi:mycothiol system anti-sigma-R factor
MSSDERWTPPIGPVDPEHPDCAAVIAEVWTLLDGECTPESRDKLAHHLEECPACLRHYGVEERVKNLIASKCGGEKAPDWPSSAYGRASCGHAWPSFYLRVIRGLWCPRVRAR